MHHCMVDIQQMLAILETGVVMLMRIQPPGKRTDALFPAFKVQFAQKPASETSKRVHTN